MRPPSVVDIVAARARLSSLLSPTPLLRSEWLSEMTGASVYLKLESVQPTRAFKIRGALNAALQLSRKRSGSADRAVVTASAGNHGRGLAMAGARLGMQVIVFTPRGAPETKKAAIRALGADLREDAPDYDAAEAAARTHAAAEGAVYISPYNDPDVIAGAGTTALEIVEQLPDLDVFVVPIGGGGLASGSGLVFEAAAPRVEIVGVEAAASTAFQTSIARGAITKITPAPSLADGLVGNLEPDSMTFDVVRRVIRRMVSVDETAIENAIVGLAAHDHVIAEGAGAVATAAVLTRNIVRPGQQAVVMLTGGNIDIERLAGVIGAHR